MPVLPSSGAAMPPRGTACTVRLPERCGRRGRLPAPGDRNCPGVPARLRSPASGPSAGRGFEQTAAAS